MFLNLLCFSLLRFLLQLLYLPLCLPSYSLSLFFFLAFLFSISALVTTFNIEIGITGAILTKLDGDSRGGAALSVKEVFIFSISQQIPCFLFSDMIVYIKKTFLHAVLQC